MPDLINDKTVTARKPHGCMTCGTAIQAGETYSRQTYVYDGRVYDWVQCAECRALSGIVFRWVEDWYDEGIGQDEYVEWAREHRDDPTQGEAARAFLARSGAA